MTFSTISMKDVEQYIEEGRDMMIIDLRNRASYEMLHIYGSVNVPFQELEACRYTLPKDKLLVLYCCRGAQSLLAARYLGQLGYQIASVAYGIAFYQGKYLIRP